MVIKIDYYFREKYKNLKRKGIIIINLPDFTFDDGDSAGGFISGFEWFTAICSIGFIVLVGIFIKKFKK
ncbi:MAG: hypothetical protein GF308_21810 [Candidatus Heimdallarchaeota archaeon]|nr:hypothetical protein [Candidatus Heimdallarchaeota archaeon]